MSDGKQDKSDITRIEDMSEYTHDEDESFEGEDSFSDFSDAKTDPNLQFPEEFRPSGENDDSSLEDDETPPDFSSLESDDSDFEDFQNNDEDNFQSDDDSFEDDSFGENSFEEDNSLEESASFEEPEFFDENDSFEQADSFDQGDSFDQEDSFEPDDSFEEADSFQNEQQNEQQDEQQDEPINEEDDRPEQTPEMGGEEETLATQATPKVEKTAVSEPERPSAPSKSFENFQELQKFAKNISYGNLASEGNPPFSIIIRDVKYREDIEDIIALLREFGILKDDESEQSAIKSLERGSMLIPRLGEYAAITVCHKLRRFDVNILMGLTEEIHPPKTYDSDDSGIVSKHTVYNSRSHHYDLKRDETSPKEVLASTTPYLEGYDIIDYIGIVSENTVIDFSLLEGSSRLESELMERLPDYQQIELANLAAATSSPGPELFSTEAQSDEKENIKGPGLRDIHEDLLKKLKEQAAQQKGNAIVGVNFHVTPLGLGAGKSEQVKYQVICSGSVVWVNKR